MFVSPLFDLTQLTNFADDNFYLEWNTDLSKLIVDLEAKLEMITKWLRDSGLVVNESKTEVCLFYKNDTPKITIRIQNALIDSKKEMNVLGVIFDSKLNWSSHVASTICKAKKALYALKVLRKFFNDQEMRILLDSYFYSVLYYNAVLWLTPELSSIMKQSLLSISANALRSCMLSNCNEISFVNIHKICKKCTPSQIMSYQAALHLHKTLSGISELCSTEHATILTNIVCTTRQLKFEIIRNNKNKIGMNTVSNKFYQISKLISLDCLNFTFVHFKKIMKIQFLKNGKT